ncbi:MAG: class I tRNA ligase family protein, partial [Candidatus Omnitrophica bacterium]|nr:class I tRNA ligase family protein [Candidatus Omnitrophota bacterium]
IKEKENQVVMYKILEKFLRLIHPFMPFISEEIWQNLPHKGESIMNQALPHLQEQLIDKKAEKEADMLFSVIRSARNLRAEIEVKPEQKVLLSVYAHTKAIKKLLADNQALVIKLSNLEGLNLLEAARRPEKTISDVENKFAQVFLHFGSLIDIAKEQGKIRQEISTESKRKEAKERMMANPEFVKKADPAIVENTEREIRELEEKIKRLEKLLDELR